MHVQYIRDTNGSVPQNQQTCIMSVSGVSCTVCMYNKCKDVLICKATSTNNRAAPARIHFYKNRRQSFAPDFFKVLRFDLLDCKKFTSLRSGFSTFIHPDPQIWWIYFHPFISPKKKTNRSVRPYNPIGSMGMVLFCLLIYHKSHL